MRLALAILLIAILPACTESPHSDQDHDEHGETQEEFARGRHGGRMLEEDDFGLELAIFETGVEPEFRVWLYEDGKVLPPTAAKVRVELKRLDGEVNEFSFAPEGDYLRGSGVVHEPHSFDVTVTAERSEGATATWSYSSYEGRTSIAEATAQSMGVEVANAAPQQLNESLTLSGTVQADPARISRVRARYPGVVRQVLVEPGDTVSKGKLLAQIQSNESLQNYPVTAPIAGSLVDHRAQVGEATGEEPLFTIIDVSKVWVEMDVFQSELARVEVGQRVVLFDLDRKEVGRGHIARIAPLAMHGSQSVRARVAIDSASGTLRPGQFVSAQVTVAERSVPLAVRRDAVQRFREFDVVFERVGDVYEVRMLELGRSDDTYVEVLSGLKPGTTYVTKNSYLIKADIEKSGASHDH